MEINSLFSGSKGAQTPPPGGAHSCVPNKAYVSPCIRFRCPSDDSVVTWLHVESILEADNR